MFGSNILHRLILALVTKSYDCTTEIRRLRGEVHTRCTWSMVKRSPDQVRGTVADLDCKGIIFVL
jgi:hypothetical protein